MEEHQQSLLCNGAHSATRIPTSLSFCTTHLLAGHDDDDVDDLSSSGCSRPFLVLDMVWNLAFVVVSVVVLLSTLRERPSTPLRVWICGYLFQCLLHVGFVYNEHQRRNRHDFDGVPSSHSQISVVERLESVISIISPFWWALGFFWIVIGGQALLQDSPRLYWLAVIFLAFDVFFMIFCIGMACIVFMVLFCTVPIIAIAYAMTIKEGASEDDIRILPKYRFHQANLSRSNYISNKQAIGTPLVSTNNFFTGELALPPEDSECCICLSQYVDGAELYSLPCGHHFHCGCISRWLRINATCPLCKFNILRGDTLV